MRKICARKMASVNDQSASNVTACPKNRRESPYTWVVPALQCKEGRRRSMKASHDRALRAFVTTYAQSSIAKILTLADRALSSFPRAPLSASRYHEPFPAVMRCCSEEAPPSASDSLVRLLATHANNCNAQDAGTSRTSRMHSAAARLPAGPSNLLSIELTSHLALLMQRHNEASISCASMNVRVRYSRSTRGPERSMGAGKRHRRAPSGHRSLIAICVKPSLNKASPNPTPAFHSPPTALSPRVLVAPF